MIKTLLLAFFILASNLSIAQEVPQVQIEAFKKVIVKSGLKVEIEPAPTASMAIGGGGEGANILQDVKIVVKGGTAIIEYNGKQELNGEIRITLRTPELASVVADNNADVSIGQFSGKKLTIKAKKSSRIKMLQTNYRTLDIELDNSAIAELAGSVRNLALQTKKNTRFIGGLLVARSVSLKAEGSSDIEINATNSISARIENQGNVRCYGAASNIKLTGSSAGNFKKVE